MLKNKFLLLLSIATMPVMAQDWNFDVYLDKSKIGTHTFNLSDSRLLTSRAKFNVKVLFIEAYKYDHTSKEQFDGDCLKSLESNTTENKVVSNIKGAKKEATFEVTDGKKVQSLPACTTTFAYWNPKILEQTKLLNPQNAEYLDAKFENLGNDNIMVKGKATDTTHYKLKGALAGKNKLDIELWYANNNKDWVALKSVTPEGYNIIYKLK